MSSVYTLNGVCICTLVCIYLLNRIEIVLAPCITIYLYCTLVPCFHFIFIFCFNKMAVLQFSYHWRHRRHSDACYDKHKIMEINVKKFLPSWAYSPNWYTQPLSNPQKQFKAIRLIGLKMSYVDIFAECLQNFKPNRHPNRHLTIKMQLTKKKKLNKFCI